MNNLLHLKGLIESIDKERITVFSAKEDKKYYFYLQDLPNAEEGEKIDLLIMPSFNEEGFSKILTIKTTKKAKPIKMANFSTMLSHMRKNKDRLKATLKESDDPDTINDLQEKIDWLEKGIELFS